MELEKLKVEIAKKNKSKKVLKNAELNILRPELKIITKPTRTISGVAPVAIMMKPKNCEHGSCTYCCGGVNSSFGDIPKSYTGNEPASMRAKRNKYDAYLQIFNRLEHYVLLGQVPEKVELIIMGGTFSSYPKKYQESFVRDAFRAMNDFGELFFKDKLNVEFFKEFFEIPGDMRSEERKERLHKKILENKKESKLEEEQLRNEDSKIKCVTFCVENRPDVCTKENIDFMLKLGVTRVEIGVQSLNDDVLKKVNRGHDVKDSIKAIQLLKNSGLKFIGHWMVGLPGSNKKNDIEDFKELFSNPDYKPDGLKIYPCMVMPGTKLYEDYKKGLFKPLTTEQAGEIVKECKKHIPTFTRVYRVQRDIPTKVTVDGVGITNFRQYVHQIMEKEGLKCKCIRCREPMKKDISWKNVKLKRLNYDSSDGKEVFLSFEDIKNDVVLGFLRLRKLGKFFRPEITKTSAIIREIHIYGELTGLGRKGKIQHRGLGKKLIKEAEKIAKNEWKYDKMLVIAGIGVKSYFYKLGYNKDGIYVSKHL